jgi:hypothetical protein
MRLSVLALPFGARIAVEFPLWLRPVRWLFYAIVLYCELRALQPQRSMHSKIARP